MYSFSSTSGGRDFRYSSKSLHSKLAGLVMSDEPDEDDPLLVVPLLPWLLFASDMVAGMRGVPKSICSHGCRQLRVSYSICEKLVLRSAGFHEQVGWLEAGASRTVNKTPRTARSIYLAWLTFGWKR